MAAQLLDGKAMSGVLREEIAQRVTSLKEKGITFSYEPSLVDYLTEKSYSITYGARNLRRCIQKDLEDPMAARIIESYESPITQIRARARDGAVALDCL